MRRMLIGIALVTVGIVVAACSSGGSGGTGGTIEGINWKLTSYDFGGTETAVPDGFVVNATFKAGQVSGFSGCNVYNASATVDGAKLTIGKAATTMKACEPTATDLEASYLGNLSNAATFTATADKLTIYNKTGKQVLAYAAGAANPLEGEWLVTGYNNGKEAVTSADRGHRAHRHVHARRPGLRERGLQQLQRTLQAGRDLADRRPARDHDEGLRAGDHGPGDAVPDGAPDADHRRAVGSDRDPARRIGRDPGDPRPQVIPRG